MMHSFFQTDFFQQSLCRFMRLGQMCAANQQRHHDIFESREFREEMVKLEHESNGLVPKSG
jgi:hypothetical protein